MKLFKKNKQQVNYENLEAKVNILRDEMVKLNKQLSDLLPESEMSGLVYELSGVTQAKKLVNNPPLSAAEFMKYKLGVLPRSGSSLYNKTSSKIYYSIKTRGLKPTGLRKGTGGRPVKLYSFEELNSAFDDVGYVNKKAG